MAITAVDKVKINKYLKECSIEYLSYADMCEAIGKRSKISHNEFLEYFTDCVVNELRKNDKISMKHLTKVVAIVQSFVVWINEANGQISEDLLNKIRSFKNLYEDYLARNGFDEDSDFSNNYLDRVLTVVNDLYPSENNTDTMSKYISRIGELEDQVKKLEQELSGITSEYKRLIKDYDKKSNNLEGLKEKIASLRKDVRSKNKEIAKLYEVIESLTKKNHELEGTLSQAQSENELLRPYKQQYEELAIEVEGLRKTVEEDKLSKIAAAKLELKHSKIVELLYQKLLFERVTVDGLLEYVQSQGIVSDVNEISFLLKRMSGKINIDSNAFSVSPMYKIVSPSLLQNSDFSISVPSGCKYFDIMLVSDFHIQEFDKKTLVGINELKDYCVRNGISFILNLGDFYHGFSSRPLDYQNAIKNYNIVEQTISLFPKADGLYHAILGGNHERNIANYGFDSVRLLAETREDFINLGYMHSNISFDGLSGKLGAFGIHHPDSFDFNIDEESIGLNGVVRYLDNLYDKQGRNRENSYIDFFGHTHRSQFNASDSYCFVPAYFKNGANHLRIYFNEDTDIKYMVCMPLGFNNDTRLVKNNEIIYQKKLGK